MSKHPTSTPTASTIFATYWVDHFFKELREAYLKAKLGGYRRYESDLESLLGNAQRAMPENSKERKVFAKVKVPDSETSRPRVRLANQLNTLSIEIFGKELLPASDEITINYLVNEEYNVCPKFDPAYQRWLIEELRKKNQVSDEHPDKSPLKEYIDHVAAMLHNIFINAPAATAEMFMTQLMKFVKLEQDIKHSKATKEIFPESPFNIYPRTLRYRPFIFDDSEFKRKVGRVTIVESLQYVLDQLAFIDSPSHAESETETTPSSTNSERVNVEIPTYTPEELEELKKIKHLLETALDAYINDIRRPSSEHTNTEVIQRLLNQLGVITPSSTSSKEEVPPYTQEELKEVETIKHLLEVAFNEHIAGKRRVSVLFELLKKLEDYQQYSPSNI